MCGPGERLCDAMFEAVRKTPTPLVCQQRLITQHHSKLSLLTMGSLAGLAVHSAYQNIRLSE